MSAFVGAFAARRALENDAEPDLAARNAALVAAIVLVGVAGLVKQSGVLDSSAPTVGLGESREDLVASGAAKPPSEAEPAAPQDQKEMAYSMMEDEFKRRRGGSSSRKKRTKKK